MKTEQTSQGKVSAPDTTSADTAGVLAVDDTAPDPSTQNTTAPDPKATPSKDTPVSPEKPAAGAPEKYTLTLDPAKYENVDPAIATRTAAIASELGLDHAKAQRLLDFLAPELSGTLAERLDAIVEARSPGGADWQQQAETWRTEALNAPDLGGGNAEKLTALATRTESLVKHFFPKEVLTFLEQTGMGNNPEFLRGFNKIAAELGDPRWVAPTAPVSKEQKPVLQRLYPTMFNEDGSPKDGVSSNNSVLE